MKLFKRSNKEENGCYSMFKIIGAIAIFMLICTWFIKAGYFEGENLVEKTITKLGLVDFFLGGFYSFNFFLLQVILLITIGGFYGVLSKTSGYKKITDTLGKFTSKHKTPVILIVSLIFAILSSIALDITPLIIFVPLIVTIFTKAGMDKFVSFSTTFGSILLGVVGSTYSGYGLDAIYSSMKADPVSTRMAHIVILVIAYVILNMFSIMRAKNKTTDEDLVKERFEEEVDDKNISVVPIMIFVLGLLGIFITYGICKLVKINPLAMLTIVLIFLFVGFFAFYFHKKNKKSTTKCWPIALTFITLFVLIVLGYSNWTKMFDTTLFTDFHNWLTNEIVIETGDTPFKIFGNIIGTSREFGNWDISIAPIVVLIASLVVSKSYGNTLSETLKNIATGMKKILVPTLLYALAHVLVVYSNWLPILNNIVYGLTNGIKFSVPITMITGFISAIFSSDPGFISYLLSGYLGTIYKSDVNSVALIMTSMFGFAQFVIPTGILLFAGLNYCDIKYSAWIKYAWKILLGLLVALLLVFLILG